MQVSPPPPNHAVTEPSSALAIITRCSQQHSTHMAAAHEQAADLTAASQGLGLRLKPCMQVNPPPSNFAVNATAISASLTTATSSGDPAAVMSAVRTLAASTAAAAPPPNVVAGVTTIAAVDVRPHVPLGSPTPHPNALEVLVNLPTLLSPANHNRRRRRASHSLNPKSLKVMLTLPVSCGTNACGAQGHCNSRCSACAQQHLRGIELPACGGS